MLWNAIADLPATVHPMHMTDMDVMKAISTMNEREIKQMLDSPGLEAALQQVYGGNDSDGGGKATKDGGSISGGGSVRGARNKKILL